MATSVSEVECRVRGGGCVTWGDKGRDRCETSGCDKRPSEDKPFCSNHVDEMPYVKLLRAKLEWCAAEVARAEIPRNGHCLDVEGIVARDLMVLIRAEGEGATVHRIRTNANISKEAVVRYVRALSRARKVRLIRLKKGTLFVKIRECE